MEVLYVYVWFVVFVGYLELGVVVLVWGVGGEVGGDGVVD